MTTLADLQEELAGYKAARDKILAGQSVTIGDTQISRASLSIIETRIKELEWRIARLSAPTRSFAVFRGGSE